MLRRPLDWEDIERGSFPSWMLTARFKKRLRNLWKWSNFGEKKVLYGRRGHASVMRD